MELKQIDTRLNEVRLKTSNIREMLGKYLAFDVLKTWIEDFVDPDTTEVVTIERSEMLFKRGTLLDVDKITEIQFFQGTGDITEVEVSNQQRMAKMVYMGGLAPWSVSIQSGKTKKRFLLYANCVQMAIDVIKDFVELNFDEPFFILNVRNFTDCIIIPDDELKDEDGNDLEDEELEVERKFYQIDVCVKTENGQYTQNFVIREKDVDSSMLKINEWLQTQMKERAEKRDQPEIEVFDTAIEKAIAITCTATIEKEFSLAYVNAESL